jgi:hypothetical protein
MSGCHARRRVTLRHAEDGAAARHATTVALFRNRAGRLVALFRCPFVRLVPAGARRDDDLWKGDVVEMMIAPDAADRRLYFEIEVNPAGLTFDALIRSPDGRRETMQVDRSWDPGSLRVRTRVLAGRAGRPGLWLVRLSLEPGDIGVRPRRPPAVGLFRIDCGSSSVPGFLALAPTLRRPADFHLPDCFVAWDPERGGPVGRRGPA